MAAHADLRDNCFSKNTYNEAEVSLLFVTISAYRSRPLVVSVLNRRTNFSLHLPNYTERKGRSDEWAEVDRSEWGNEALVVSWRHTPT